MCTIQRDISNKNHGDIVYLALVVVTPSFFATRTLAVIMKTSLISACMGICIAAAASEGFSATALELSAAGRSSLSSQSPLEVGGSHVTVGQVSRNLSVMTWRFEGDEDMQQAELKLDIIEIIGQFGRTRMLEVEGDEKDTTNTSLTTEQYGAYNITGKIIVTGYRGGIDSNGDTNHTLEVAYKIGGLSDLNCSSEDECVHGKLKEDDANYCDGVHIGQLENAESDVTDISDAAAEDDNIILKILSELLGNVDEAGVVEAVNYINIGKPVSDFFDTPMALLRHDGTILACSVFAEVKGDDGSASGEPVVNGNTSGASIYNVTLMGTLVLVSSAVALIMSV